METTQIPLLEGKILEMGALNERDEAVQTVTREIRDVGITKITGYGGDRQRLYNGSNNGRATMAKSR